MFFIACQLKPTISRGLSRVYTEQTKTELTSCLYMLAALCSWVASVPLTFHLSSVSFYSQNSLEKPSNRDGGSSLRPPPIGAFGLVSFSTYLKRPPTRLNPLRFSWPFRRLLIQLYSIILDLDATVVPVFSVDDSITEGHTPGA